MATCAACGERNPDRARFCLSCGRALPRTSASDGDERKTVTVVFCDLVGFTARSEGADPEDVKATLRPFHTRVKQVIEHYQGTVDQFIGDAVVGVFGAPAAHEDDPERGVRAAITIQDAIRELREVEGGASLAARIGIATGEAVVAVGGDGATEGGRVTGDVVTLAGRLQAIAPVSGVVVDDATRRRVEDLFVWTEPTGPGAGALHATRSWIAVSARGRLGVGVRDRASTPFVGREEESAMLRGAYRRAIRETSAQLVTIVGEPGVGKSRLVAEFFAFVDDLPELVRWRQGRSLPYGEGIGFWALGEIVKADADVLESDTAEEARRKLGDAAASVVDDPGERDWLTERLAPLLGLEAEAVDRAESFAAWRRYLEALAARSPLVLVFEDLQWADPGMLEFLEDLLDWTVDAPLLVLCAARPELLERHPGWGGGKRNSTTISLPPLSSSETAMLVSALLERRVLPAETQLAILERAGGNPLYAEEFARMLVDDRAHTASASSSDPLERIPVPETVHALIAARLDALSSDDKALLHDAAVVGTVFWAGALAAMGGLDEQQVTDRLHHLARRELIRPARASTVRGEAEYAFWHVLVRDVAYGQIPRSQRGPKHRAAAEWIEGAKRERLEDRAELLAHHYAEALELARAAAQHAEAGELQPRAARFLRLAGDRAMRLDAETARRYYERAAALLDPADPARASLLVKLAESSALVGAFDRSDDLFAEAIDAFLANGDDRARGEAMAMFARSLHKQGSSTRSRSLLREAVAILERLPPGPELALAYSRLAGQLLVSSRYEESLGYARKGLELARATGLDGEVVRSLQFRGAGRVELGDEGGLDDLREALRLGLDLGLGEETALAYGNLAYQVWLRDGPAASLELWERAAEFTRARGFATQARWSEAGMLETLFDLGAWDRVLEMAADMVRWDQRHGDTQIGLFARLHQSEVLYHRGGLGDAERVAREALASARLVEYAESLAPALALVASIERRRGDRAAALDLVEEFRAVTRDAPDHRAGALPAVVRTLIDLDAIDLASSLVPDEARIPSTRHKLCVLSARAAIAAAKEDHLAALDAFREAARRWGDYGHVLERANAHLGEARSLLELGRTDEAQTPLDEARSAFELLGAVPAVSAVDDLASRSARTA